MRYEPGNAMRYAALTASILWAAGLAAEPQWTDAEKEDFLRRAEIVRSEELTIGVTHSRRATLTLDGRSHDAHIQTVDVTRHRTRLGRRTVLNFRDCYLYNIAAYRLDRMLGLGMVPVSVERTVGHQNAAVTWWVDDVQMMERDRLASGIQPPHPKEWMLQRLRRRLFNELISNTDFNQGNQLITNDWKVWLIDFTRAFGGSKKLIDSAHLWGVEAWLLQRLSRLTPEAVESRLSCCLTRHEQRALLARRDLIVQHFEHRARQGEAAVLDVAEHDG